MPLVGQAKPRHATPRHATFSRGHISFSLNLLAMRRGPFISRGKRIACLVHVIFYPQYSADVCMLSYMVGKV